GASYAVAPGPGARGGTSSGGAWGTGQKHSIDLLSLLPNVPSGACLGVGHQGTGEDSHECAESDDDVQLSSHAANSSVPKGRQDPCFLPSRPYRRPMAPGRRLFEALGGECELYAVGVPVARLADGEAWVHEMHD